MSNALSSEYFVSTTVSITFCVFASIVSCFVFNPNSGTCGSEQQNGRLYEDVIIYCVLVAAPFFVWALFLNGTLRRFVVAVKNWKSKDELEIPLSGSEKSSRESAIGMVTLNFFDRWAVVTAAHLVSVPFNLASKNAFYSPTFDSFLQIWAVGSLFNDICLIMTKKSFEVRNAEVDELWQTHNFPQHAAIYLSLAITGILVATLISGAIDDPWCIQYLIPSLQFIRLSVQIYQLMTLGSLIKVLHRCNDDLVSAIVSTARPLQAIFRRSVCENSSMDDFTESTSHQEGAELVDYSQVYLELVRVLDLLKMVMTLVSISIMFLVILIISSYASEYVGGSIVGIGIKIVIILLPWIYAMTYKYNRQNIAVQEARRNCIAFVLAIIYAVMAIIGCILGCDTLTGSSERLKSIRFFSFFIYLAKSTALPTTVSLGLVILTSPGIRSWFEIPLFLQYVMAPTAWLPPHTVQQLHEALGANFVSLGVVHSLAWFVVVGLKLEPMTVGLIVALVTGVLMLTMSLNLLWQPGVSVPFKKAANWPLYDKLDQFLKDSKYGSMHVYLARSMLYLYIIHAIFFIKFAFSWYFIFPAVCYLILFVVHPAKRRYLGAVLSGLTGGSSRHVIVDSTVGTIRDTLSAVRLTIELPVGVDIEAFKGCGDTILVRLLTTGTPNWSDKLGRMWETVHYFSIVGIKEVEPDPAQLVQRHRIEVKLLIQKTKRNFGAASALRNSHGRSGEEVGLEVVGFVKSNSLEAIYSPSIIAFGFESGAAAFCSLLQNRTKLRGQIDAASNKMTDLTDLCVVWTQFIGRRKGPLKAEDVAEAVKGLCDLQEYLYQNSGGRGVKMLFICTGPPPEWTPAKECIAPKERALEAAVARHFGLSEDLVTPSPNWGQYSRPSTTRPTTHARSSFGGTLATINLRMSTSSFKSLVQRRSSNAFSEVQMETKRGWPGSGNPILEEDTVSGVDSKGSNGEMGESGSSDDHKVMIASDEVTDSQSEASFANPAWYSSDVGSLNPTRVRGKGNKGYGYQGYGESDRADEGNKHNMRRHSLFSVNHHFAAPPAGQSQANPFAANSVATLLQTQAREESWVPMRQALGASWQEFKDILDVRITSAITWLNEPDGPDYTTIFVPEQASDMEQLRDFKYADIYDEVNRSIIEQQLRYCKNPSEFLAGRFDSEGDPINPMTTACAVLYSGDYASDKKSKLYQVVRKIRDTQQKKHLPASLSFIPDA